MPWRAMPWRNPRFDITVATTVSCGSAPRALAVDGEDGEEVVAVDHRTGAVDRDQPVGVAVEGETEVGAGVEHGCGQQRRARSSRRRR